MSSMQVKTGTTGVFRLSNKDEQVGPATAQWYVLVRLGRVGSRPGFYVVPALVISALMYVGHRLWPSAGRGLSRSWGDEDRRMPRVRPYLPKRRAGLRAPAQSAAGGLSCRCRSR